MLEKRLKDKLTKENLWIYILKLLEKKERYGYELRDSIEEEFGFLPGNVTAYRVLYALQKNGLVASSKKEVKSRERKYYSITTEGKKELEEGKDVLKSMIKKLD
jgi:PadR family transcriptional regulator, regulatory protein PadR